MSNLTAKQEKFCQNIVKGMTQYDAYCLAYTGIDTTNRQWIDNEASLLMKNPEIVVRIDELKKPVQEAIKEELKYTALESFRKLNEIQDLALTPSGTNGKVEHNPAIKAEELKGKLAGLYVDKTENTNLNYNQDIEIDLDDED